MIIAGTESFFFPGTGKKEVVLLLHGFAVNTAELLPLGNFLKAQGYTVFAPRLPGAWNIFLGLELCIRYWCKKFLATIWAGVVKKKCFMLAGIL